MLRKMSWETCSCGAHALTNRSLALSSPTSSTFLFFLHSYGMVRVVTNYKHRHLRACHLSFYPISLLCETRTDRWTKRNRENFLRLPAATGCCHTKKKMPWWGGKRAWDRAQYWQNDTKLIKKGGMRWNDGVALGSVSISWKRRKKNVVLSSARWCTVLSSSPLFSAPLPLLAYTHVSIWWTLIMRAYSSTAFLSFLLPLTYKSNTPASYT